MICVEELIRMLDCEDQSARLEAVCQLRDLGPVAASARQRLVEVALEDRSDEVRGHAADALAEIDNNSGASMDVFCRLLFNSAEDRFARNIAARNAWHAGAEGLERMYGFLTDADPVGRMIVLEMFQEFLSGCWGDSQAKAWVMLRDAWRARIQDAYLSSLGAADSRVRYAAISGLGAMGVAAADVLRTRLESANALIRVGAACALLGINPADSEAIRIAGEALGDHAIDVRSVAGQALSTAGIHGKEALEYIVRSLPNAGPELLDVLALCLCDIRPSATEDVVTSLMKAIVSPDWDVKSQIALTVSYLDSGPSLDKCVPYLKATLEDYIENIEDMAHLEAGVNLCAALGNVGPSAYPARKLIRKLMKLGKDDENVRNVGRGALAQIDGKVPSAGLSP